MSTVRRIKVENRLAKLVQMPGGISLAEALDKADQNLEVVKDQYLAILDEKIARIEQLAGAAKPAPATVDELYAASNDMVTVAGVFALGELGQAAYSFCELLDRLRQTGAWSPQAVAVHVSAMKLLRHPQTADSHGGCKAVLEGLRQVTDRAAPRVD